MGFDVSGGDITRLLAQWTASRPEPPPELITLVYRDLRQMAGGYMRHEKADHVLQTTALVHEAYLRVFHAAPFHWENRQQFFAAVAKTMRRILVDYARSGLAEKRWDRHRKVAIEDVTVMAQQRSGDLVALDDALEELAQIHPRQGQVVELLWFVGLTREETAAVLDVSVKTVQNDWRFARAWLQRQLGSAGNAETNV